MDSIGTGEEDDVDEDSMPTVQKKSTNYSQPHKFIEEVAAAAEDTDPFAETRTKTIAERQSKYHERAMRRQISPDRADAFGKKNWLFFP